MLINNNGNETILSNSNTLFQWSFQHAWMILTVSYFNKIRISAHSAPSYLWFVYFLFVILICCIYLFLPPTHFASGSSLYLLSLATPSLFGSLIIWLPNGLSTWCYNLLFLFIENTFSSFLTLLMYVFFFLMYDQYFFSFS